MAGAPRVRRRGPAARGFRPVHGGSDRGGLLARCCRRLHDRGHGDDDGPDGRYRALGSDPAGSSASGAYPRRIGLRRCRRRAAGDPCASARPPAAVGDHVCCLGHRDGGAAGRRCQSQSSASLVQAVKRDHWNQTRDDPAVGCDCDRWALSSYVPSTALLTSPVMSPVFRGRRRELSSLQAAWTAAAGREAPIVVVHGEAGIGKTRLVSELGRLGTGAGRRRLVGHMPRGSARSAVRRLGRCRTQPDRPSWRRGPTPEARRRCALAVPARRFCRVARPGPGDGLRGRGATASGRGLHQAAAYIDAGTTRRARRHAVGQPRLIGVVRSSRAAGDRDAHRRHLPRQRPRARSSAGPSRPCRGQPGASLANYLHLGPLSRREAAGLLREAADRQIDPSLEEALYARSDGKPLLPR